MTPLQQLAIILYGFINFLAFIKGLHEVRNKKNPYGLAGGLGLLGIFVWGDAIILGPFWVLASIALLFTHSFYVFLLSLSLFWAVRSLGEIIYWLLEQFTDKHHNPPHTLYFYKYIKSDAIWFIYQVFWQCMLVISLLACIYFTAMWLNNC